MEQNFEKAFEFAMECEQYRSDNPKDPGGFTIWGISSRYHPATVEKMKSMTKEDARDYAKGFYRSVYWESLNCDKIASPLDIIVFDTSIVPGPGTAQIFLDKTHDWRDYLFLRLEYFANSKFADNFLKGWVRKRIINLWKLVRGL